jgi:acyl-CoA synthetase (AMP-forming)/AMP-acid ligase II
MILGRCLARNALLAPGKTAVVADDGRSWTYAQLNARVDRLAAAMRARGLGRGTRVAVLDRNSPEYLELYFAAGTVGAWLVAVNFHLKPDDVAFRLEHSQATALFVGAEFLPIVDALPEAVRRRIAGRVWVIGASGSGLPGYESLLGEARAGEAKAAESQAAESHSGEAADAAGAVERVDPEDVLYIGYTSGTTGTPKGAMVSHRAIVVGYLYKALDYGLTGDDVSLSPGPFWHSAPRDFATLALYLGGTCIVMRSFEPREYLRLAQRHRATFTFMVPTMYQMLVSAPETAQADLSSLRVLISGGSPLPTAVKDRVVERFGPILNEFYGATETRIITNITAAELATKRRSVGRAIRDVEVRVLDEAGRDLPAGEVGEIYLRGPGLFSGYLDDPERTRKAHRCEWFSLGDVGRIDADGYLTLVDRKQDVIISGGENIYPNDVEEVLMAQPGVKEAALNDLLGGQIPVMFDSVPGVLPHVQAGKLRALGVTSKKRVPSLPDVPTIDEAGVKGFEATAWFGMYGPGKMPDELAARINRDVNAVLAMPAVKDKFASLGADAGALSQPDFTRFVDAEIDKWAGVVRRAGIQPE